MGAAAAIGDEQHIPAHLQPAQRAEQQVLPAAGRREPCVVGGHDQHLGPGVLGLQGVAGQHAFEADRHPQPVTAPVQHRRTLPGGIIRLTGGDLAAEQPSKARGHVLSERHEAPLVIAPEIEHAAVHQVERIMVTASHARVGPQQEVHLEQSAQPGEIDQGFSAGDIAPNGAFRPDHQATFRGAVGRIDPRARLSESRIALQGRQGAAQIVAQGRPGTAFGSQFGQRQRTGNEQGFQRRLTLRQRQPRRRPGTQQRERRQRRRGQPAAAMIPRPPAAHSGNQPGPAAVNQTQQQHETGGADPGHKEAGGQGMGLRAGEGTPGNTAEGKHAQQQVLPGQQEGKAPIGRPTIAGPSPACQAEDARGNQSQPGNEQREEVDKLPQGQAGQHHERPIQPGELRRVKHQSIAPTGQQPAPRAPHIAPQAGNERREREPGDAVPFQRRIGGQQQHRQRHGP